MPSQDYYLTQNTTEGVLHHLTYNTTDTPLDAAISDNTIVMARNYMNIQGHNTCARGMLQHRGTWHPCHEVLQQPRTQVCHGVVGAPRSTHTTGYPAGESKGHAGDGKQQATASTQHQPSLRVTEGVSDRVIATHNRQASSRPPPSVHRSSSPRTPGETCRCPPQCPARTRVAV